jgi:hypothetical protein
LILGLNWYSVTSLTFPVEFYSTQLTVRTPVWEVPVDDFVNLTGRLTNTWNNTGIYNQILRLDAQNDSGTFRIGLVDTLPTGDYWFVWKPQWMGNYRLVVSWNGTDYYRFSSYGGTFLVVGPAETHLTIQVADWYGVISNAYRIGGHVEGLNGPIANANVILTYSVPDSSIESLITSVKTDPNGNYATIWTPQATGDYSVKASWEGSSVQASVENTTSLSITNLYLGWNMLTTILPVAGIIGAVLGYRRRHKTISAAP